MKTTHATPAFCSRLVGNLALAILPLLLLTTTATAQKPKVNRWAVLVGVDDYVQVKDLKYCGADMRALRDRLVASGFPAKQVKLLHDDAKEKRFLPFKVNIEQQIKLVLKLAGEDDMVVIAFSGHGVHHDGNTYLCPTSAKLGDPDTFVSLEKIYGQMKSSDASLKLMLVDACRNDPQVGGQKTITASTKAFAKSITGTRLPEGSILINSCTAGEISWEDAKFGHGVFMHYLLEGLDGKADRDKSGIVTISELFKYASLQTKIYVADRFNDSQRPFLRGDLTLEALEFSFGTIGERAATKLSYRTWEDRSGKFSTRGILVRDGSNEKRVAIRKQDGRIIVITYGNLSFADQNYVKSILGRTETGESDTTKPGKTFTNSVGMKLVTIPAGEFKMGSPASEKDHDDDEAQHAVRLSRGFYMSTTEVTQGQFKAIMGTTPWKSGTAKENADHAASYIDWNDATEYCVRLSKKEGRKYRLPTEAEWEYACRGGSTTAYSLGDDASGLKDYGWFDDNAWDVGEKYAHQVGQKRANAFGLFDMHGNVYEWCSDWYDEDYYGKSPSVDPKGPTSGSSRVLRGGSWCNSAQYCRSAGRRRGSPSFRVNFFGFRLVCELD